MKEREQLDERYLEAQLREELGPERDLSERVLRQVYAKPVRRIVPPPRRKPFWQPLAAAASVLIVAGLATFALVKMLPQQTSAEQAEHEQSPIEERNESAKPETVVVPQVPNDKSTPEDKPDDGPKPQPEDQPKPDEQVEKPTPEPEPEEDKDTVDIAPHTPEDEVEIPDPGTPSSPNGPDRTDPPESWPGKVKETDTTTKERAVLVSAWSGEGIKINGNRIEPDDPVQIRAGDNVRVKGFADFTLVDGTLLRVDGEITFEGDEKTISLQLNDGALYADTATSVRIGGDGVSAVIDGLAVVEERLRALDLYCLRGVIRSGEDELRAGYHARLEDDGIGREKAMAWTDVQREFRFLKDAPVRALVQEDLDEAPGKLFGGVIKEGVLRGESDSETGIGFYFSEPYTLGNGDVVRFRFRVEKACELILQFGSVENGNWRHKMGGVKAGEWIEYELPLAELYKTTDVARKAEPGLALKFFQLHPEETSAEIRIDSVKIVRRPD